MEAPPVAEGFQVKILGKVLYQKKLDKKICSYKVRHNFRNLFIKKPFKY